MQPPILEYVHHWSVSCTVNSRYSSTIRFEMLSWACRLVVHVRYCSCRTLVLESNCRLKGLVGKAVAN